MNKIDKILKEIVSDEKEINIFSNKNTVDEVYEYFLSKDSTITKEEFDEYVSNKLESYKDVYGENIPDEFLGTSGGVKMNFGSKVISTALASLSMLSGLNSSVSAEGLSNTSNIESQNPIVQESSETSDSKESLFKRGWKKVHEFYLKHPKFSIALPIVLLSGIIGTGIFINRANSKADGKDASKNKNNKSDNKGNVAEIKSEIDKNKFEQSQVSNKDNLVDSKAEAIKEAEAKAKEAEAIKEAEAKAKEEGAKKEAEAKAKEEGAKKEAEAKAKEAEAIKEAEAKAKEEGAKKEAERKAKKKEAKREAKRKAEEEEARRKAEEKKARKKAERKAKKEEERRAEEEEARRKAEEAERRAEEEEARRKAEEAERRAEEEEARRKAEEAERKVKEEEARRKAEEEAKANKSKGWFFGWGGKKEPPVVKDSEKKEPPVVKDSEKESEPSKSVWQRVKSFWGGNKTDTEKPDVNAEQSADEK